MIAKTDARTCSGFQPIHPAPSWGQLQESKERLFSPDSEKLTESLDWTVELPPQPQCFHRHQARSRCRRQGQSKHLQVLMGKHLESKITWSASSTASRLKCSLPLNLHSRALPAVTLSNWEEDSISLVSNREGRHRATLGLEARF